MRHKQRLVRFGDVLIDTDTARHLAVVSVTRKVKSTTKYLSLIEVDEKGNVMRPLLRHFTVLDVKSLQFYGSFTEHIKQYCDKFDITYRPELIIDYNFYCRS